MAATPTTEHTARLVSPASNNKTVAAAALLVSLALAACAGKSPPREAAAPGAPQGGAAVVGLAHELVRHPRAVYSSNSGKYSYFVGGRLIANYDPESHVLVVTGQGQAEGLVCKYAPDGALFVEAEDREAAAAACRALIAELHHHMAR